MKLQPLKRLDFVHLICSLIVLEVHRSLRDLELPIFVCVLPLILDHIFLEMYKDSYLIQSLNISHIFS